MSGFFGFRREIFRPLGSRSPGYKLLLYVLVMARGRKVVEVPYEFASRNGGTSKIAHGFGFIRVFLAEVLRARRLEDRLPAYTGLQPPKRISSYDVDTLLTADRVESATFDIHPTDRGQLSDSAGMVPELPTFSLSSPEGRPSSGGDPVGLSVTASPLRPHR